jgi:hypothetical protein
MHATDPAFDSQRRARIDAHAANTTSATLDAHARRWRPAN